MHRWPARVGAALMAIAALHTSLRGQVARVGVVDDASGLPVVGAVVALLDADLRVIGEGVSGQAGAVRIALARAAEVRVQVRRIGYRPWDGPRFVVRSGETRDVVLRVMLERVALPAVTVVAEGVCPRTSQPGAVADMWTQLGTAIRAARLTRIGRQVPLRVRLLERDLGASLRVTETRELQVFSGAGRPFASRNAAWLRDSGWARLEPDGGLTAWAPDEDVLLSSEFSESHCFSLVRGRGADAGRTGLAFEPAPGRLLPDIGGVIWADDESSQLSRVEFGYRQVGGLLAARAPDFGGVVQFRRLDDGAWIIPMWELRMPRFRQGAYADRRIELAGYLGVGGDAVPVQEVVPPGRVTGVVVMGATPVSGGRVVLQGMSRQAITDTSGRFAFDSVPPGEYLVRAELDGAGGGVLDSLVAVKSQGVTPVRLVFAALPVVASTGQAEDLAARLRERLMPAPTRPANHDANLAAFRTRAKSGVGTFLDSASIARRNARTIPQLMSGIAGVRVIVGAEGGGREDLDDGSGPFVLAMRSAPGANLPPQCAATLFLDGRPTRAAELSQIDPATLAGVEIYTRGSFIPPQYGVSRDGCGGVLFWSR